MSAAPCRSLYRKASKSDIGGETLPITIHVQMLKGRGLSPRDSNGLSDPYAVLQYGITSAKTKTIRKTLNPEWNETLTLGSLSAAEKQIEVKVWDWDYLARKHDFIGQFSINLAVPEFTLSSSSPSSIIGTPKWYSLTPRFNKNDGPVTGEIYCAVSLIYNDHPFEGWLTKRGGVRRNWKRRWFVLQCNQTPESLTWSMRYYPTAKDAKAGKALGSILLTGASLETVESSADEDSCMLRIHTVAGVAAVEQDLSRSGQARMQLAVRQEGVPARVYELKAESKETYDRWLRQLEPLLPPVMTSSSDVSTGARERRKMTPLFGEQLADIMARQRALGITEKIPLHCEEVIKKISGELSKQGLFRIAGARLDIDELIERANTGKLISWESVINVHTATGFFKHWLRELSEPVLTYELYDELIAAVKSDNDEDLTPEQLQTLRGILARLPEDNFALLKVVCKLCSDVASQSEVNLMTPKNIAIVMSPNLLWDRARDLELAFSHLSASTLLCRSLIDNFAFFFEPTALVVPPRPPRKLTASTGNAGAMRYVDEARKLFAAYDYDGNGSLDKEEFWAFFSDAVQCSASQESAKRLRELGITTIIKIIDSDGDGEISKPEFLEFWTKLQNNLI